MITTSHLVFDIPADLVAGEPPEARGLRRDEVRLLVARQSGFVDTEFASLGSHLEPGDLLVVNTSQTMPAAVDGRWRDQNVVVHFSTLLDEGSWTIELRPPDQLGPILEAAPGDVIRLDGGSLTIVGAAAPPGRRLWRARIGGIGGLRRYLRTYGRPIRYAYVGAEWDLAYYQTLFANRRRWPASAEMPSAGRPFTRRLVGRLTTQGVRFAHIELHSGVSSPEAHETPQPERFLVTPRAADDVNRARSEGRRVVAVGTTVARALETVASADGRVTAGSGWTNLVLSHERRSRVIDGLITGWHPSGASHLSLLEAAAGPELVSESYRTALDLRYSWHEFGDSCLLLP